MLSASRVSLLALLLASAWQVAASPAYFDQSKGALTSIPCSFHCLMVQDQGHLKAWFYIDGEGLASFLFADPVPGGRMLAKELISTQYLHRIEAAGAEKTGNCGSDGWGWQGGELISAGAGANGSSWTTQYSHAGRAVRVVSNASGTQISQTDVASGVKSGTPSICAEERKQVLQ